MKIRTKIFLSHVAMALAVTLICGVIVGALQVAERNQQHLKSSYDQIRSINLVTVAANDYAEQIAELFILGPEDTTDLAEAKAAVLGALEDNRALIEAELEFIRSPDGRQREETRLLRVAELTAVIDGLDRLQGNIRTLLMEGRRAEAVQIYRAQIEHSLDSYLDEQLDIATRLGRDEVDRVTARSQYLSRRSMALAVSAVLIVGSFAVANTMLLNRTISAPIAALSAATDAVGRGDLGHVVGHTRRDELGALASRFDAMTVMLRDQRDKLMEAKTTLERQVEDRTRELRERSDELEVINASLRDIDASRGQFFADISHELRTPLTILRGEAEVALRDPRLDAGALRAVMARTVRKAEQMGRLVEDLLFLARSEAGVVGLHFGTVAVQDVIAEVLIDSQSLSHRDGITLSPRQPAEPVIVQADPERLRQAVLIALDNAIRFAPPGSAVTVSLRTEGGMAEISVGDKGRGFTSDEIASAFTRFHRSGPSRGRSGRGVGIGLSIARWIMNQHGGTVRIASTPGNGAIVSLSLPLTGPAEEVRA